MKRIPITSELIARLQASFGAEADVDGLVVFEAIAANDLPLRKSGGIYRGARISASTKTAMAAEIERESVPLQLQHNTEALPSGRVFAGKVVGEELFVQFAISSKTQPQLIADLDAGVIDQISVGIIPEKLLCSECSFDYLAPNVSYENWWSKTCTEGHMVGVDGVHVRLVGLQSFLETSLVGKGAVNGARVIEPSDSVFAANSNLHRLAATVGVPKHALTCSAITSQPAPTPKKESKSMDEATLGQLTAAITDKAKAEAALAPLQASLDAAQTALTAANAKVTELEAKVAAAPSADDQAAALSALTEIAKGVLVATGEKDPKPPTVIAELLTLIKEKTAAMTALLPIGGRSEAAPTLKSMQPAANSNRAFEAR